MAKSRKKKVRLTPETKCSHCPGTKCCTYITQKIPGPRSRDDFDHLLWQLAHRDVQAYRDSSGWYLLINSPCRFLEADGRCGIYATRPQLCRDYSNDYCEFDAPAEEGFELFFDGYESLLAYCRRRFRRWEQRFESP
ncbi:YkgJ family cysteine cluster protein [Thiohalobacter sp. IOR34]|uniref:YkgJ family cysteine cluster protein n=1 Tax=Thiohalobacter sp. IOR34 TaxID=3057176 RepID=UPI0025B17325|nr:YkgJ family cysteine cluster protein [Thiohalobacter sp. IOR34]WJW75220.1 YkgJ family cysteine cluster protein [Thiohalobacter sp. IOR34]